MASGERGCASRGRTPGALSIAVIVFLLAGVGGQAQSASGSMPDMRVRVIFSDPFPSEGLVAVACPTADQCTAIDGNNEAVTFNPLSPGVPTAFPLGLDGFVARLVCPATTQCTGVTVEGQEVTFNPVSPLPVMSSALYPNQDFSGVSCPTTSQCTALGYHGHEITFNPDSPGSHSEAFVEVPATDMGDVSCPSATQCTAAGANVGGQFRRSNFITFNPTSPARRTIVTAPWATLGTIDCPSQRSCTAVGQGTRTGRPARSETAGEVTFNPTRRGKASLVVIQGGGSDVSCPTASLCASIGVGVEATFRPGVARTYTSMTLFPGGYQGEGQTPALSCPTTTQCTAVGKNDFEDTFNPGLPRVPPKPPPPKRRRKRHG
jgi:hypothetical protein